VYVTGPVKAELADGGPIETVGAVLSTSNVGLGLDAGHTPLPLLLLAVPAGMLNPRVPSPVIPDSFTVRVLFPLPLTRIVVALGVVLTPLLTGLRIMLPLARLTEEAPV
jgi:hypothetical protein